MGIIKLKSKDPYIGEVDVKITKDGPVLIGEAEASPPRLLSLEELPEHEGKRLYVDLCGGDVWPLIQIGEVDGWVHFSQEEEDIFWGYTFQTNMYEALWRCWTAEPTKEQRREAKWEASS